MHIFTHLKPASEGKTGLGIYADGMVEHDGMVGQLLDKLKALGIEDNTIVMYSTDNGAETFTWPDGGTTMFRGEKNTQWEGGYRVPTLIRWPGTIKPGTVINDICAHEDMLPTLLAAAGDPGVADELLKGKTIGDRTYKVHLDGYFLRLRSKAKVNGRVRNSFTGRMTATLPPYATRTGRSPSWSRRPKACAFGRNPSMCCAHRC
jgi:arylsulfatase A-like enzyme